jgi:hypothetical protein
LDGGVEQGSTGHPLAGRSDFVVSRLPDDAKPASSCDCNKATTVVGTLRGPVAVATFDQSVAQSYELAGNFFKEAENAEVLAQLKTTQTMPGPT